ncbi:hypothetical protein [Streptomyces sp. NBC_00212]|uniref:hypothetical protein n=1 Tax=Streptomyces sp. NBC_00212 TaxID=2975684 RepID=UPI00324C2C6C
MPSLAAVTLAAATASSSEVMYPSFKSALNKAVISAEADLTAANLDGAGNSLSVALLRQGRVAPGARVTVNRHRLHPARRVSRLARRHSRGGPDVPVVGSGGAFGSLIPVVADGISDVTETATRT